MIVNIILILLTLNSLAYLIYKPKTDVLYCGIFGWLGKSPKKFNKHKFNILGIYNDERGGDSCGVSVDYKLFKGVHNKKKFIDFVEGGTSYSLPKKSPIVLGHTRRASIGSVNIHNAHPYGIGGKPDGSHAFVGSHNGTLVNHEELAKKYKVPLSTVINNIQYKSTDSKILLSIINKTQSAKVLSEYIGAAALVWSFKDSPNTTYVFRGASRLYESGTTQKEERPLFYVQNTEGTYISSIKDSLKSINDTENPIKEFKANLLYEIVDGDMSKAKMYKIDRSKAYQKEPYNSGYYGSYGSYEGYGAGYTNNYRDIPNSGKTAKSEIKRLGPSNKDSKADKYIPHSILAEVVDPNTYNGKIYFNRMKYYRNGHPIQGIYTWVEGYGFVYISNKTKNIERNISKNIVNNYYDNGIFFTKSLKSSSKFKIPYTDINQVPLFYFYKGIKLISGRDYNICLNLEATNIKADMESLSFCSSHPVIDGASIIKDGEPFTGTISPLLSPKIYTIKNGLSVKVVNYMEDEKVEEVKYEIVPQNKVNSLSDLDKLFSDTEGEGEEDIELPLQMENDLLNAEIENIFKGSPNDFDKAIERLKVFKDNDKAHFAIQLLEDFIEEYNFLIDFDNID